MSKRSPTSSYTWSAAQLLSDRVTSVLAQDARDIYFTRANATVCVYKRSSGVVDVIAGVPFTFSRADGEFEAARFSDPLRLAGFKPNSDDDELLLCDGGSVRSMHMMTRTVTTVIDDTAVSDVCFDAAGDKVAVFLTRHIDQVRTGAKSDRSSRISMAVAPHAVCWHNHLDGGGVAIVATQYAVYTWSKSALSRKLAGDKDTAGFVDAAGESARFNGLKACEVGADGAVYMADCWNKAIRRLDVMSSPALVTTLCTFDSYVQDLTLHSGNTLIAATYNGVYECTSLSAAHMLAFASIRHHRLGADSPGRYLTQVLIKKILSWIRPELWAWS